ncbi:MAG: KaiC domain-containing protein, partial [Halorientalis sp.]
MSEDDGDDDWFERALQDEKPDEEATEDESGSATEAEDAVEEAGASPSFGADAESETGGERPFESEAPQESEPFSGTATSPEADDGDLFEEDFASAFGDSEAPGGEASFDDESLESDIPRIELGIEGLDEMIQGGLPERHLVVTVGAAGTGKTTFGLQFLEHGLRQDDPENAVFITLEQSREAILDTAAEHGWPFERYESEDHLAVVDLDPVEMANSLQNIRSELPRLVREFGADRLVLDSVSLLEMMYDDRARRRTEVYDFTRSLKRAGVTTMLTSEASETSAYASRHGIIEYLTDAVIFLRYVRQETRETRMAVEIQKIRNANHSRETKPYEIT